MKKIWVVNEVRYPNGDMDVNEFNPNEKDACFQHSTLVKVYSHTQNHGDWKYRAPSEVAAIARLVAAAPAMLEALKRCLKDDAGDLEPKTVHLAMEAIAKAEGEDK